LISRVLATGPVAFRVLEARIAVVAQAGYSARQTNFSRREVQGSRLAEVAINAARVSPAVPVTATAAGSRLLR
jgi:hypothetical protein